MKAVRIHARGGSEQLVYEDAPIPELRASDAVVRVQRSAVTNPRPMIETTVIIEGDQKRGRKLWQMEKAEKTNEVLHVPGPSGRNVVSVEGQEN